MVTERTVNSVISSRMTMNDCLQCLNPEIHYTSESAIRLRQLAFLFYDLPDDPDSAQSFDYS